MVQKLKDVRELYLTRKTEKKLHSCHIFCAALHGADSLTLALVKNERVLNVKTR